MIDMRVWPWSNYDRWKTTPPERRHEHSEDTEEVRDALGEDGDGEEGKDSDQES